ncbi:MAG TPA: hypothetical protein VFE78_13775 [Gemmataceae bacterium]|nr:hypothetical protein [Gemmataceae bacterium]
MTARPDGNEGFRLLDDFVCEAVPGPGAPSTAAAGRGVNAGVRVVVEVVGRATQAPLTEERAAELRALSNSRLPAPVRPSGPTLSLQG